MGNRLEEVSKLMIPMIPMTQCLIQTPLLNLIRSNTQYRRM